eukprot:CAMPEP_0202379870 /NCGR_PEP_ID=MMETSP1127-20130417/25948_1 /ASSEMBLY_ACC=CAM_ASM_000462 /TAXON_ID=3047 /ORGANISM="Dunaliella tertiolecta, Strain CCMP1320" /LENGTH=54 /DNA_ID=CAMNT_0048978461 /DNA_START=47 /DNA_END=207 /DNA_ORIENTATION=-
MHADVACAEVHQLDQAQRAAQCQHLPIQRAPHGAHPWALLKRVRPHQLVVAWPR